MQCLVRAQTLVIRTPVRPFLGNSFHPFPLIKHTCNIENLFPLICISSTRILLIPRLELPLVKFNLRNLVASHFPHIHFSVYIIVLKFSIVDVYRDNWFPLFRLSVFSPASFTAVLLNSSEISDSDSTFITTPFLISSSTSLHSVLFLLDETTLTMSSLPLHSLSFSVLWSPILMEVKLTLSPSGILLENHFQKQFPRSYTNFTFSQLLTDLSIVVVQFVLSICSRILSPLSPTFPFTFSRVAREVYMKHTGSVSEVSNVYSGYLMMSRITHSITAVLAAYKSVDYLCREMFLLGVT